jgi:hypothetical protein
MVLLIDKTNRGARNGRRPDLFLFALFLIPGLSVETLCDFVQHFGILCEQNQVDPCAEQNVWVFLADWVRKQLDLHVPQTDLGLDTITSGLFAKRHLAHGVSDGVKSDHIDDGWSLFDFFEKVVDKQVERFHLKVSDSHHERLHFGDAVFWAGLELFLFIKFGKLSAKLIQMVFGVFRLFMLLTFFSDFLQQSDFRNETF